MDQSNHSIGSGKIQLTTYDPAEPKIPICWKCDNRIVEAIVADQTISATTLIGCKGHSGIKNYEDAKRLCPLLFNTGT
jgi:hypothetical protein